MAHLQRLEFSILVVLLLTLTIVLVNKPQTIGMFILIGVFGAFIGTIVFKERYGRKA